MAHLISKIYMKPLHDLMHQRGAALLMVVLILIVMSTMLFINARVTFYEQLLSGNDRRAKLAHHIAEAGISHAMRYFTRNVRDISSIEASGWLPGSPGANKHWVLCEETDLTFPDGSFHPCAAAFTQDQSQTAYGRIKGFARENVFYFVNDFNTPDVSSNSYLPLQALVKEYDDSDPPVPIDNANYQVQALLCAMDYDQFKFDSGDVETYTKCDAAGQPSGINVAIMVISTGTADDGLAQAIITQTLANVEPGGGPPSVPLMSFNSISPNGTLNIIVNPNAGGVGVPISVWSRNYAFIEEPGAGSVATCELEEYLATKDPSNWRIWVDADGVEYETCDSCTCPDKESEGALSHTQSTDPARKYFDIVDEDPDYPDDVFEYYFGVARTEYRQVRDAADEVLADCSTIDTTSHGLVWIDNYCDLSGKEVGSAISPVALVTTKGIKLNGNTVMYGVLVITDPSIPPEEQAVDAIPVSLTGGPILYGAIINDPGAATFNGGFTIVYMTEILGKIHPLIILGNLSGSWTDQVTF